MPTATIGMCLLLAENWPFILSLLLSISRDQFEMRSLRELLKFPIFNVENLERDLVKKLWNFSWFFRRRDFFEISIRSWSNIFTWPFVEPSFFPLIHCSILQRHKTVKARQCRAMRIKMNSIRWHKGKYRNFGESNIAI